LAEIAMNLNIKMRIQVFTIFFSSWILGNNKTGKEKGSDAYKDTNKCN